MFIIIATSHYSPSRFTLTRKNFTTPLGTVTTDQPYLNRIIHHFGNEAELFSDPFAHLPEHSIELEVVILQALLENHRPFRIVPLLCGSYRDAVESGRPSFSKRARSSSRRVWSHEGPPGEAEESVSSGGKVIPLRW